MTDEERDQFEDEDGDSAQSTDDAPDADDEATGETEDSTKRINDLMSNWQKAEARAKRAEAALAARSKEGADEGTDERRSLRDDPEVQSLKAFLLDSARETVYKSDPRLERYGVEIDALEGDSPEAIRKSFTRQLKLIDQMEARIQDSLLAEHGLAPEVRGGAPDPVDVAKMSSEEFDKYIEDSLAGRR